MRRLQHSVSEEQLNANRAVAAPPHRPEKPKIPNEPIFELQPEQNAATCTTLDTNPFPPPTLPLPMLNNREDKSHGLAQSRS